MQPLRPVLRLLRRYRTYSAVSATGIGLAVAAVLIIASHIRHEQSFDEFHPSADRLYQVTYQEVDTPAMRHVPTVSPPVAPTMVRELAGVEAGLRFRIESRSLVATGEKRFFENGIVYADSTLFEVLGFDLIRGDARTALVDPSSIVLTRSMADKYFGQSDPVGQTLSVDDERSFTVTGIMEDVPDNTHIRFDFVLPFDAFRVPRGYPVTLDDWQWISFPTFVRLGSGVEPADIRPQLDAFMERHFPTRSAEVAQLVLKPIEEVYLTGPVDPAFIVGNAAYLDGLRLVAALILVLSVFNFANLSSVQSLRRSRELGVRRALGASNLSLLRQLIGETTTLAAAGLATSIFLVAAASRWAPDWVGADRALALFGDPVWMLIVLLAVPVLGLIAGLYPGLFAIRLDTVRSLKDSITGKGRLSLMRQSLVVLQFAIAVGLIIAGLVVTRQLQFISNADLGFEKEHVLSVQMEGERLRTAFPAIRSALTSNPNVIDVAATGHLMDGDQGSVPMTPEGGGPDASRAMNLYGVGYNFAETMGLELIRGRDFSRDVPSDSADAVVINETAARIFETTVPGWNEPLGKWLRVSDIMEGRVIGVVRDFHFTTVHAPIEPLVMIIPRANMDNIVIRVAPGNTSEILSSLEESWVQAAPDLPFDYRFLDDYLTQQYGDEQAFQRLVSLLAMLSIIIAALGLYGLVSFICTVRTREIAIRKALGARVDQAVTLLLKPFGMYVILANIVAWPLAWYMLQGWLEGFQVRIDLSLALFIAAGAGALIAGLLTVFGRTLHTARTDPAAVLSRN